MAVHPPSRHEEFRGLSICAGVGGLDLGVHLAEPGYRAVCYVERNAYAAATLVARMADTSLAPAPVWDDLRSFDGRTWRDRVHLVTAGYPCQPFTLSGNRLGADDPRHLWPDVARIIGEARPEWVFFENVPGHLSLGFNDVAGDLQGLGYRVAACVVSAAETGASHLRERLFILGHAYGQKLGEPGLRAADGRGNEVSERPEPDRQPDGPEEPGQRLVAALGNPAGSGVEGKELQIYPPAPGRLAQWREALRQRPELKPGLHRLADGMACGVERSAAAGNGVVPLAAARAYAYLKGELEDAIRHT